MSVIDWSELYILSRLVWSNFVDWQKVISYGRNSLNGEGKRNSFIAIAIRENVVVDNWMISQKIFSARKFYERI